MKRETRNMADELLQRIDERRNPSVVGLDPSFAGIPEWLKARVYDYDNPFEGIGAALAAFNKMIIDAVADVVPAVKPQTAYYEQYGSAGLKALEETIRYARGKGLLVIVDAKRNDIGSTAEAYASGYLGAVATARGALPSSLNADFLTVNPYLGSDGLEPFLQACKQYSKGMFILVKTSNPSSGEIQDRVIESGVTVYQAVAEYVAGIGEELVGQRGYSAVGAVVGATYPHEAESLREIMKKSIFLVPGYGAQGGSAQDVVPCFNGDGYGAVVNSARGIIYAYKREPYKSRYRAEQFHLAAREAAISMRDDIVGALQRAGKAPEW